MDAFETASLSKSSAIAGKKIFSITEANRALTLVRKIVADIVRDYKELRRLHDGCRLLEAKGDASGAKKNRQFFASINDHLAELNEELEKVGCQVRDYQIGMIDFPALLNGREVYLCWALGEEKVEYWRPANQERSARRPLAELDTPA